jgi:hypothetical protein
MTLVGRLEKNNPKNMDRSRWRKGWRKGVYYSRGKALGEEIKYGVSRRLYP